MKLYAAFSSESNRPGDRDDTMPIQQRFPLSCKQLRPSRNLAGRGRAARRSRDSAGGVR